MPFRTKDFLFFLLTVAFLIIGITMTAHTDLTKNNQSASVFSFDSENDEVIYNAVLPDSKEDTRPSRLAELREKIADLILTTPEEAEPEIVEVAEEVLPTSEAISSKINLCSGYSEINPKWSPTNLLFEIVEGARIVYRKVDTVPEVGETTASEAREVVLQLPLRTFPLSIKSCLGTDIVGVALDGSLIRNNEHTLYQVFGGETLIGYALDGFPIYGMNDSLSVDECGGAIVAGEYRYYLALQREGVLGCYGGVPVTF